MKIWKTGHPGPKEGRQKDGQTDGIPPVFYRTLSPLGPLPCFHSLQFTITQSRAMGIADHILPFGDLFKHFFFLHFLMPPAAFLFIYSFRSYEQSKLIMVKELKSQNLLYVKRSLYGWFSTNLGKIHPILKGLLQFFQMPPTVFF